MLQKLRDQTQNTGFKVLVGAIIVVLTLFGFGATNLFMAGDPELARVGDFSITQNVVAVETQRERNRILSQLGPDFDPANIDIQQLSQRVVQQLVNRQVIYQTATNMGIATPADEINRALVENQNFQVDGSFNEALYRQNLNVMGYTPTGFLADFTNTMNAQALVSGVQNTNAIPDWELAEIIRVVSQTRDLAFLPLNIADFESKVTVTDEDIEIRYEEEQANYMTELQVDAQFITLGVTDLLNDPSIEVSDEDLQSLYEDERNTAQRDEQRDSSHILVQSGEKRSEADALSLIQEIATRLEGGEEFETLAEELSEDPGSAAQGGALGAVGKGVFDPAFEEALWSLTDEGQVSAPVKSAFGYHLIRLEGIVEADYPSLESQRADLETRVRRIKAYEIFEEKARELEESVYDEQYALDETAAAMGLEIGTLERVQESGVDHPVLGNSSVLTALFDEDVLAGSNSQPVAVSEEQLVVVRAAEQYPPELKSLEEVADEIRAAIRREQAQDLIEVSKQQGLTQLDAGESVTAVATALGSRWQSFEQASRSPRSAADAQAIPQEVRELAFSLPRPTPGQKSMGSVSLADGSAALVTVTRVVQGDMGATSQAEIEEIRRAAQSRAGRLDLQSLLLASENKIGVERPAVALPEEG